MMTIPMQLNETEYSIFIILEDGNIERIKEYDPAEISIKKLQFKPLVLKDVVLFYATPEEIEQVKLCKTHVEIKNILRLLSRGFKFRPELGDSDNPYESLKK